MKSWVLKLLHLRYNFVFKCSIQVKYCSMTYAFQVGMYIGEMCRYVMATPCKPEDSKHCIRMMLGNGMRSTIWKGFMERFKIGQVAEFYGSTEGNANMSKFFSSKILLYF